MSPQDMQWHMAGVPRVCCVSERVNADAVFVCGTAPMEEDPGLKARRGHSAPEKGCFGLHPQLWMFREQNIHCDKDQPSQVQAKASRTRCTGLSLLFLVHRPLVWFASALHPLSRAKIGPQAISPSYSPGLSCPGLAARSTRGWARAARVAIFPLSSSH
jgi:hypothetical protein